QLLERTLDGQEEDLAQRLIHVGDAASLERAGELGVLAAFIVAHLAKVEKDVIVKGAQLHVKAMGGQIKAVADVLEAGYLVAEDREMIGGSVNVQTGTEAFALEGPLACLGQVADGHAQMATAGGVLVVIDDQGALA